MFGSLFTWNTLLDVGMSTSQGSIAEFLILRAALRAQCYCAVLLSVAAQQSTPKSSGLKQPKAFITSLFLWVKNLEDT